MKKKKYSNVTSTKVDAIYIEAETMSSTAIPPHPSSPTDHKCSEDIYGNCYTCSRSMITAPDKQEVSTKLYDAPREFRNHAFKQEDWWRADLDILPIETIGKHHYIRYRHVDGLIRRLLDRIKREDIK